MKEIAHEYNILWYPSFFGPRNNLIALYKHKLLNILLSISTILSTSHNQRSGRDQTTGVIGINYIQLFRGIKIRWLTPIFRYHWFTQFHYPLSLLAYISPRTVGTHFDPCLDTFWKDF